MQNTKSIIAVVVLAFCANAAYAQAPSQFVTQTGINLGASTVVAPSSAPAVSIYGGSPLQGNAATTPSFQVYDKTAFMGGISGLRTLPTSGTITGDYYVSGNWTQTGTIISNYARIFCAGTMTINGTWTVNSELPGGAGAIPSGQSTFGLKGAGVSGGGGGFAQSSVYNGTGGGGGGFGGAGGAGGSPIAGMYPSGGGSYPLSASLSGSGGGGGGGNSQPGFVGGNGGGSLYIESVGNVSITSTGAITASGDGGVSSSNSYGGGGGGGSGGGVQIRCLGTVTISSGGSITAPGGSGGTSTSNSGAGGGGGGGIVEISAKSISNGGTISAVGGAAGTGSNQLPSAGSTGLVVLNTFVQGPRCP